MQASGSLLLGSPRPRARNSICESSQGRVPGAPVVKTLHFPCRGHGSIPGQGTKISHEAQNDHEKNKEEKKTSLPGSAPGCPAHCPRRLLFPLPFFSPLPLPNSRGPLPTLAQKPSGPQPLPILYFVYKLFQHGELSGELGSPQQTLTGGPQLRGKASRREERAQKLPQVTEAKLEKTPHVSFQPQAPDGLMGTSLPIGQSGFLMSRPPTHQAQQIGGRVWGAHGLDSLLAHLSCVKPLAPRRI